MNDGYTNLYEEVEIVEADYATLGYVSATQKKLNEKEREIARLNATIRDEARLTLWVFGVEFVLTLMAGLLLGGIFL